MIMNFDVYKVIFYGIIKSNNNSYTNIKIGVSEGG